MKYERLKENLNVMCMHNHTQGARGRVVVLTNGRKTENQVIDEVVSDCREILNKIEQGTLIEIPTIDEEILEDYAHRMFDSWNDITGAIHNGCSWYGEVLSVIDDIVGMVYGITKRQAEKHLKELQNG